VHKVCRMRPSCSTNGARLVAGRDINGLGHEAIRCGKDQIIVLVAIFLQLRKSGKVVVHRCVARTEVLWHKCVGEKCCALVLLLRNKLPLRQVFDVRRCINKATMDTLHLHAASIHSIGPSEICRSRPRQA